MYAIIETGGKQFKVEAGHFVDVEKLPEEKGKKISFSNVLMLVNGKDSQIGNPYLKSVKVNGHVDKVERDDKVIVYKMRPKKGTRKKQGHRQWYSRVFVDSIEEGGKIIAKAEPPARKKKEEE